MCLCTGTKITRLSSRNSGYFSCHWNDQFIWMLGTIQVTIYLLFLVLALTKAAKHRKKKHPHSYFSYLLDCKPFGHIGSHQCFRQTCCLHLLSNSWGADYPYRSSGGIMSRKKEDWTWTGKWNRAQDKQIGNRTSTAFFRTSAGKIKGQVDAHALFFNTAFFQYFRMRIRDFHALSMEKPYDGNGDCLQKSSFILFHRKLSKRTPRMLQESISCSKYCGFCPLIYTYQGKSLHSPILEIYRCLWKNMHPILKHSHHSIVILFSEQQQHTLHT